MAAGATEQCDYAGEDVLLRLDDIDLDELLRDASASSAGVADDSLIDGGRAPVAAATVPTIDDLPVAASGGDGVVPPVDAAAPAAAAMQPLVLPTALRSRSAKARGGVDDSRALLVYVHDERDGAQPPANRSRPHRDAGAVRRGAVQPPPTTALVLLDGETAFTSLSSAAVSESNATTSVNGWSFYEAFDVARSVWRRLGDFRVSHGGAGFRNSPRSLEMRDELSGACVAGCRAGARPLTLARICSPPARGQDGVSAGWFGFAQ